MITVQSGVETRQVDSRNGAHQAPAHRSNRNPKREREKSTAKEEKKKERTEDRDGERPTETTGAVEAEKMDLTKFIETYKEAIARTVTETYAPLYQPGKPGQDQALPTLLRRPIGAQEHAVRCAALSLKVNPGTIIVGEMGTGKTYIGTAAAHMAGFRNILVLAPPHLVQKWKREIEMTVPWAKASIVRSITDLRSLRQPDPRSGPRFTIMSRETAKLSYHWQAAYVDRLVTGKGKSWRAHCCPGCFEEIKDKDGIPVQPGILERKKSRCSQCGGALWQPKQEEHRAECNCRRCGGKDGTPPRYRNRRYALADYVKKRMKGFFDLLIADEIHEYKARGSAQGIAGGNLAQVCGRTITLTGTLAGGYSSTLFHLLYRFTPEIRNEFQHNEQGRWIDMYGFRQRKYRQKSGSDEPFEHGRGSGRRGYRMTEKEMPGLAPSALFHIIGNTVFLRLSDVSSDLPPYEEQIQIQQMSRKVAPGERYSQKAGYEKLHLEVRSAMVSALAKGSSRLMAAYLQSLLAFPDGCTRGEEVFDPEDGGLITRIPPLAQDVVYPKEQALIDLVKEEKKAGRRVLVYTTHTDTRDLTGRIEQFLRKENVRTAVLKSTTVKSERREEWVGNRVKEGLDVLVCNPRLVQTGLDLVDFPTICWYETDYSVYTMRQASRRSWRIGQTRPVRVVFMVYENTIQTEALRLVARKMQSSLAVEGELPEEGLIAFGDDGQDLIMTLARQIVNETEFQSSNPLENIFARAREMERENERYLVEDEWHAAPDRARPDGTPEQLVTFSWHEFMAQPLETKKGRNRKGPETPSLFQWAVEQERNAARGR